MNKIYYACGGGKRVDGEIIFCLCSPSGKDSLPYITDNERMGDKLYWHSRHHTHLYRLEVKEFDIEATLVSESWECNDYVKPILTIKLSEELKQKVLKVINEKDFWSI